jgi:CelD/BcsL family acetyltransferase involved in cellulose biosynthesis
MTLALHVTCRPLRDVPQLETLWRSIEARASCSFFLTWPWIGAWLAQLPAGCDARVLLAQAGDEPLGIAVLVKTRRRLGSVALCEAWHLHATGEPEYDRLCIEHNDFLVDARRADEVRAALINGWMAAAGRAAELHLPGLPGDGLPAALAGGLEQVSETKPSLGVALAPVREAKLDFTPLLSSHARRFVRRSMKEYQSVIGALAVDEADSPVQAREFLAELVRLHEATWRQRGLPGAFATPAILAFHDRLIELAWPEGRVQLLRIRTGERAMGYLYSFVRGQRLYVYQSGFDYSLLEKHGRPGLVAHTLAIQHNAARGYDHYDLLAGESQYKSTVSTVTEAMTWAVWRKPALRFTAERLGRQTWRRWRAYRQRQEPSGSAQGSAHAEPEATES